ncbi:MAG: hypothetical protein R3E01_23975 [Pirellulaceae bacterium]|nr:hypothetical protein [Planctomycetales bacterium]
MDNAPSSELGLHAFKPGSAERFALTRSIRADRLTTGATRIAPPCLTGVASLPVLAIARPRAAEQPSPATFREVRPLNEYRLEVPESDREVASQLFP